MILSEDFEKTPQKMNEFNVPPPPQEKRDHFSKGSESSISSSKPLIFRFHVSFQGRKPIKHYSPWFLFCLNNTFETYKYIYICIHLIIYIDVWNKLLVEFCGNIYDAYYVRSSYIYIDCHRYHPDSMFSGDEKSRYFSQKQSQLLVEKPMSFQSVGSWPKKSSKSRKRWHCAQIAAQNTVNGRNSAPVDRSFIPLFARLLCIPLFTRLLCIPGGAGFLPSTVPPKLSNEFLMIAWNQFHSIWNWAKVWHKHDIRNHADM